jgi:potassium large conductance calcium-activated channel subfamily M alpha protein 1
MSVKVEAGTRGFFIAGSIEEIKRAFYYCETCHKDVTDLVNIKKCKCNHGILIFFFFFLNFNYQF